VNGLLDENRVRQALKEVIKKKPRRYVAILSHFHRLVKLDVERRTARVESSIPPSDSLKSSVTANLAQRLWLGIERRLRRESERSAACA
jgi:hypothetical protein